jgi:hypothetical protein
MKRAILKRQRELADKETRWSTPSEPRSRTRTQSFDEQPVSRPALENRASRGAHVHFHVLEVGDDDLRAAAHQIFTADADAVRASGDRGRDTAAGVLEDHGTGSWDAQALGCD